MSLKSLKPVPYDRTLAKLSDHLRKRRYELGLFQKEAAQRIDVSHETYVWWEVDQAKPNFQSWPKVIAYLGYDPHPEPTTLGERLLQYRRLNGISRTALAREIGCDPETLRKWEKDIAEPKNCAHLIALKNFGLKVSQFNPQPSLVILTVPSC